MLCWGIGFQRRHLHGELQLLAFLVTGVAEKHGAKFVVFATVVQKVILAFVFAGIRIDDADAPIGAAAGESLERRIDFVFGVADFSCLGSVTASKLRCGLLKLTLPGIRTELFYVRIISRSSLLSPNHGGSRRLQPVDFNERAG